MFDFPITYSHEHLTIDLSHQKKDEDAKLNAWQDAKEELSAMVQSGVKRIIDCSCHGMGRDFSTIQAVRDALEIEVVLASGYYKDPFLPKSITSESSEQIAQTFYHDLHHENPQRRCEIIGEIGTSYHSMSDNERKVFESASIIHREFNTVIITHTTLGTMAQAQVDFFKQQDVDLSRVILSHVALAQDFDTLVSLASQGVNLGFDTIGKTQYLSDALQLEWISRLCALGFQKQIVLSMDITRTSQLKKKGGIGYMYLLETFCEQLQKKVKKEALEDMLGKNMDRLLAHRERNNL